MDDYYVVSNVLVLSCRCWDLPSRKIAKGLWSKPSSLVTVGSTHWEGMARGEAHGSPKSSLCANIPPNENSCTLSASEMLFR
ncbi:hypothetical protein NPIL_634031 [Nephila pilipes]|uniref:Uncharacterized protein n=1 Tax=Nephila pilipes TaxID=299642 RepID=A0A8X6MS17_NEPPI|nr:hypothetical protein NPIL_634031 [Nephila pilipes]